VVKKSLLSAWQLIRPLRAVWIVLNEKELEKANHRGSEITEFYFINGAARRC
jgi:hypothetical protein